MSEVYWIDNLTGGVNQRTNPGLIKNSEFELLVNVTQEFLGTLKHRNGSVRYLNSVSATAQVRGLGMYAKQDGANYLHMVSGGNLYVDGGASWTTQASTEWATTSDIDMENFLNRNYMASSAAGENLRYATETGATTDVKAIETTATTASTGSTLVVEDNVFSENIVGATVNNTTDSTSAVITAYTSPTQVTLDTTINDTWDSDNIVIYIDGKHIAVNGAYMMIVGNSTFPRRAFYSNVESDTFSMATDFFRLSYPPTGVASFGTGRPFVIFHRQGYAIVDPQSLFYNENNANFGCSSHRSIQNVRGRVIWFSGESFYMLSANQTYPSDISASIQNRATGDAILDKVNSENYELAASWQKDNRYFCAFRDLTGNVKGEDLDSVVVEIDLSQNNWKLHTYTANDVASVATRYIDSSEQQQIYAGSFSNGTVHKLEVQGTYTDDDKDDTATSVPSTIKTKHYEFQSRNKGAIFEVKVDRLHFKYKSNAAVTISYSLNGDTTYNTSKSLTLPAYSSTDWDWQFIEFGVECKSISLEIECSSDFTLYGLGFEVNNKKVTGIKGV